MKAVGAEVVVGAPKANVDGVVVVPNPVKSGLTTVVAAVAVDAGVPKPNTFDVVVAGVVKLNGVAVAGVVAAVAPNKGGFDAVVVVAGVPNENGLAVGATVVVVPVVVPKRVGFVVLIAPNENAI